MSTAWPRLRRAKRRLVLALVRQLNAKRQPRRRGQEPQPVQSPLVFPSRFVYLINVGTSVLQYSFFYICRGGARTSEELRKESAYFERDIKGREEVQKGESQRLLPGHSQEAKS